ncbi:BMP family protein [uncultured Phascolarctobacterium sp.]|uniref:BMP family protein n=1 Tax=uncultured Phascolarctobacterium sp. TaxID=512296 RepID=UPI0025E87227|nr:BMP family protein [uncultured Phascolarctobacterium sp.]
MKMSKKFLAVVFTSMMFSSLAQAAVVETPVTDAAAKAEISVLLPGNAKDNGFMEAGYRGYQRIAQELTKNVKCVYDVSATSNKDVLTAELRRLAQEGPQLIIAHGGQCNAPVEAISKEFSQIKFVVIQGNVKSENVSSYKVDQEQSAFLAGALAGYMTKTDKVGHISGAWPKPGLQARAAFYDGLHRVNAKAEFYTHFTGNLDDNAVNAKAAEGEIKAGCDVIYTMLNGGRFGVNDVIAANGKVKEIGNVIDWTEVSPIFIGSAVADSSVAIFNAAKDFTDGKFSANTISVIGLENADVVRLAVSEQVPPRVVRKLEKLRTQVLQGKVKINTVYDGLEFDPEAQAFVPQEAKNNRK